jgi:two-component system response regulator
MSDQFILLVEDAPCDQELLIRALRKLGIETEIVVARDGVEALEFLFGTGHHAGRDLDIMPALVLLDLKLPRVGGLEVLRRIRAHRMTQLLPVVIVTAVWNPEQIVSGFRLQADGFICKSEVFEKLTEALGNLALEVLLGRRDPVTADVLREAERGRDLATSVLDNRGSGPKSRPRQVPSRNAPRALRGE